MNNEEKQKKIEELKRRKAELNKNDEDRRRKKLEEMRHADRLAQELVSNAKPTGPPAPMNQAPMPASPTKPAVKLNLTTDSFQVSIPPKDRPQMYECGIQCAVQALENVKGFFC